jgi:hypothetical protein
MGPFMGSGEGRNVRGSPEAEEDAAVSEEEEQRAVGGSAVTNVAVAAPVIRVPVNVALPPDAIDQLVPRQPLSPASLVQQFHQQFLPLGQVAARPQGMDMLRWFQLGFPPGPFQFEIPVVQPQAINPQALMPQAREEERPASSGSDARSVTDIGLDRDLFEDPEQELAFALQVFQEREQDVFGVNVAVNPAEAPAANAPVAGNAAINYEIPALPENVQPRFIYQAPVSPTRAVAPIVEVPVPNLTTGVITRAQWNYPHNGINRRLGYTVTQLHGNVRTSAFERMDREYFNHEEMIILSWNTRRVPTDRRTIPRIQNHLASVSDNLGSAIDRAIANRLGEDERNAIALLIRHDDTIFYRPGITIFEARMLANDELDNAIVEMMLQYCFKGRSMSRRGGGEAV